MASGQGTLSFSTDFNGVGTGTRITVDKLHIPENAPSSGSWAKWDSHIADTEHVSHYMRIRYDQQRAEIERQRREAELRAELERQQKAQNVERIKGLLEQLDELERQEFDPRERMKLKAKILTLAKDYDAARSSYLGSIPSYRQMLMRSVSLTIVPPPEHPLRYRRVLMWGLFQTPAEAAAAQQHGEPDPFSSDGSRFDRVFAFGNGSVIDWNRVILDHFLGEANLLSSATSKELKGLVGAYIDELVCHSNGCRVAEVLIETGKLKVNHLRILGGDGALMDLDYLSKLKESKGLKELSVYAIRGDLVPQASSGWQIMEAMEKIRQPLVTFQSKAQDLCYQVLGVVPNHGIQPGASVEVHVLSYPAQSNVHFVEKHLYDKYARVITGWQRSGCFDASGEMNRKCLFYARD